MTAKSSILITDEDIDKIEALFGNVHFDEQRRNVIKHMQSKDIQAFPGTGKTTVLVAKLAILAQKWPYKDQGICVLSHTNVAREEIEKRLGNTSIGGKLLSYPHFIGTVHSFLGAFAANPWLRSKGYPIVLIDRDIALSRRYHRLDRSTKIYLNKKNNGIDLCESKSFPASIDLSCSSETNSYRNVKDIIEQSFKEGYFTFDEILYAADDALSHCDCLSKAIQQRFPVLFMDEAQDTSSLQWNLLEKAFPNQEKTVCQYFGDENQAIFHSLAKSGKMGSSARIFPQNDCLTISNSYRFGEDIARLSDSIGLHRGLTGQLKTFERMKGRHTIFLFENAEQVLPAYAQYLLDCFSDAELEENPECFAIGMVHNTEYKPAEKKDPKQDRKYPCGLKDYWPQYRAERLCARYPNEYCIQYFRKGMLDRKKTGEQYCLIENIAKAFKQYLEIYTNLKIHELKNPLRTLIAINPDKEVRIRRNLNYVSTQPIDTKDEWEKVVRTLKRMLKEFFGVEVTGTQEIFFSWIEKDEMSEEVSKDYLEDNIYKYKEPNSERTVQVHLSSIHAQKGRTHLATLVMETYWYDRNIETILPWVCGMKENSNKSRINTRRKCHYVAMTRACALVCMAIPKNAVSDENRKLLKKKGWRLVDLSNSNIE